MALLSLVGGSDGGGGAGGGGSDGSGCSDCVGMLAGE